MASKTISFTFKVDDTLTNVTSAKLSDPTGAYGVKRNDTDAVVVADDTAFTHDGTGTYSYEFDEPTTGLTYTYWIEVVYAGRTYRWEKTTAGTVAIAATAAAGGDKLTFYDAMQHVLDFARDHGAMPTKALVRRVIQRAYDEVVHAHDWTFLHDIYRIQAYAAQTSGTVAYDHDTYQLTLSSNTWPTWATKTYGAAVLVDDVICDVQSRTSSTILTLSSNRNPGADVASGASYTLFPRWYALPNDFLELDHPVSETLFNFGKKVSLADIAARHRFVTGTNEIQYWAVGANPNGGMALHVHPALDQAYRLDVPYKKRPSELRVDGLNSNHYAGTVSTSGSTVTGSSSAFSSDMVGAMIWLREDSTVPTGVDGDTPYTEAHQISAVSSTTSITTETTMSTLSDVKYRITDPINLERVAWDAFLQCCEKQLARMRNYKEYRQIEENARRALRLAMAADHTASPRQTIGASRQHYRLKDMRSS